MPTSVAVQLYSIRDFTTNRRDLAASLRKIKSIGYDGVQFSAVGAVEGDDADTTVREARALMDDNGLRCVGAHRRWSALRDDTAREIEFLKELGCPFVAVPMFVDEYDPYEIESYSRFLDDAVSPIAVLKAEGIALGYHNHAHEFMRSSPGGTAPYDILVDRGGPDVLLEVDVYWAAYAGVNPASLFPRIHGRATYVHAKDMELVRGKDQGRAEPFFAAVGEGNLDWDSIIPAAQAAGAEVWIVEQDLARLDIFDCLQSSYEYLVDRVT